MVPQDVAAWLAGSATLVQLAAAVGVVLLSRRNPFPWLSPVAIGVLSLMLLRRALAAAAWPDLIASRSLAVTHEAAGLGISLAVAFAVGVLWRVSEAPVAAARAGTPDTVGGKQVASAREEERELLCYDLHDGLAPLVVGSRMHLDAFRACREADTERAERELALMTQCLGQAVDEVTRVISDLSLAACPEVSVSQAVRRYLDELSTAQGWTVELDDRLEERRFPTPVETTTFRLVQEALNNAAKHAQADRVRVSLEVQGEALVAVVQDWGRGFDPEHAEWNTRRIGLRGMCSRARLIGGSCSIESEPGKGTKVTTRVPCCGTGGSS